MSAEAKRDAAKGWHSRGYLPHFDSPEIIQHLVLRTADSLPAATIAVLSEESRRRLQRLDDALDLGHGAGLLRQERSPRSSRPPCCILTARAIR